MKSLFLILFFFIFNINVSNAKWTWVAKNINDTDFYVDMETIKKNEDLATVWELVDNQTVEGYGSSKNFVQYNCENYMFRPLRKIAYHEKMGTGKIKSETNDPLEWRPIKFNVAINKIFKIVCRLYKN